LKKYIQTNFTSFATCIYFKISNDKRALKLLRKFLKGDIIAHLFTRIVLNTVSFERGLSDFENDTGIIVAQ